MSGLLGWSRPMLENLPCIPDGTRIAARRPLVVQTIQHGPGLPIDRLSIDAIPKQPSPCETTGLLDKLSNTCQRGAGVDITTHGSSMTTMDAWRARLHPQLKTAEMSTPCQERNAQRPHSLSTPRRAGGRQFTLIASLSAKTPRSCGSEKKHFTRPWLNLDSGESARSEDGERVSRAILKLRESLEELAIAICLGKDCAGEESQYLRSRQGAASRWAALQDRVDGWPTSTDMITSDREKASASDLSVDSVRRDFAGDGRL
ncbi:hypothetical protein FZEAL_6206 [Fusarium zealandicum]|uniref:Uncharacterized protein n=1 Tax=Fusarium zealandicum TaxID=1053134 RepID=A0A8H4UJ34_9HYPO|nr:hypothetical protein FZEAL_6206 [Fusarium zealandicum]